MCKIAMMSGIKPKYVKSAWELSKALAPYMSHSDDDGFGYAAITKTGDIFIERWLDNDLAFKYKEDNKHDKALKEQFGEALVPLESNYTSVGKVDKNNAVAIILHARMATCAKGIKNVHPFIVDNVALIHNGVISNHVQVLNKYDANNTKLSTCDSEAIAFAYSGNKVGSVPAGIKEVGQDLSGYYACGVLSKTETGKPYMDVFKSASANLYGAFIPQIDAFLYCTSLDILKTAVKDCGFTYMRPHKIKEGLLIRHDAVSGKASVVSTFEERSYSSYYGADWDYETRTYGGATSTPHAARNTNTGIYDATVKGTPKVTTYNSWEDYQNKKYGSLEEAPAHKEAMEANALIVKENTVLPKNTNQKLEEIPKFILGIKDGAVQSEAFDDYLEITDRYEDFRALSLTQKMKA